MENKNIDEETDELAGEYLEKGIFPEKYASDSNHIAIADMK